MSLRRRIILASIVAGFLILNTFLTTYAFSTKSVSSNRVTSSTKYPNFQGIYEFSGHNTSTDATNPSIVGTNLIFYWAQLEPKEGQYNWNIIDQAMAPWTDNGKNVILRVTTAGWKNWDPAADSAHGTPQWVYAKGVKSVTETDGAVLPQYWNSAFLQSYSDFIQAFANRYDGNAHVKAIQMGIGVGGETKVDSRNDNPNILTLWESIGYTDKIWWSAVQQMINSYTASFHQTPVALMPDKSFIGNTSGYNEALVVNYAASHGAWLQDNGLVAGRTLSSNWNGFPLISEQRDATTAKGGGPLLPQMQAALNLGAIYILVFASDIELSSNQSAIQQVAALANTPTPTPTATNTPASTPTATDTPTPAPTDTPTPAPTDTPTSTPTDTPTPTVTATSTPTPASYRYSFEDGTTDDWSYNHADSLANSTTYAFDGTHSLKTVVKTVSTDGYANVSISNTASGSPAMPAVGQTITAQVYVPSGAPAVKAVVFVKDSAGTKFYTSYDQVSNLPTGQWTEIQFTVPSTISGGVAEYGVRFQFPSSSSSSLNAYIDAVNW